MIALAGLIYLPMRVLMGISIAIIALHNLLDDVSAERFGRAAWIWDILYQRGVIAFDGIKFRPAYPVLPWIGVMAGGYCLGMVFDWDADRRRRFLVRLGLALTAAFVVVRAVNIYGDPARWSHQASPVFTVLSFLNVTKYPPSLDFLLMTLGPAMVVMAWLENFHFRFHQSADCFRPCAVLLLRGALAFGPSDCDWDELRALRRKVIPADCAALHGRPQRDFFRLTTDSHFGRCMRSGLWYCCFSIRHAFGLRDSNSVGMIGG